MIFHAQFPSSIIPRRPFRFPESPGAGRVEDVLHLAGSQAVDPVKRPCKFI